MISLNWEEIKQIQKSPRFVYEGKDVIPPKSTGGAKLINIDITSDAHFYSEVLTITYNTLDDNGDDDGVNHLSVRITDGDIRRELNTDFIDLANIAVPGRQRTTGIPGDPSSELHVPGFPWPYLWSANGAIQLDTRNDSESEINVTYQFHGFKFPVSVFGAIEALSAQ